MAAIVLLLAFFSLTAAGSAQMTLDWKVKCGRSIPDHCMSHGSMLCCVCVGGGPRTL